MALTGGMLCSDILMDIFQCLDPGYEAPCGLSQTSDEAKAVVATPARRESQKTLARAARVCRAFSEPALDVLWRNVDSVVHLLSLLPAFALSRGHGDDEGLGDYCLMGEVTENDWTNLRRYASRVRSLTMESAKHLPGTIWVSLADWCQRSSSPFLPNLARLDVIVDDYTPVSLNVLLSPTGNLTQLRLIVVYAVLKTPWRTTMEVLQPCLKCLTSLCITPMIPAGSIPSFGVWERWGDSETVLFNYLSHVRVVDIAGQTAMSFRLMQILSELPHLHTLSLDLVWLDLEYESVRAPYHFARLDVLRLRGDIEDIAGTMAIVSFGRLHTLAIDAWEMYFYPELEERIRQAVQRVPTTLRHFEFQFTEWDFSLDDENGYRLSNFCDTFRRILELDLEEVAFTFQAGLYQLSTPVILEIVATHWHNLTVFRLGLDLALADHISERLPSWLDHNGRLPDIPTLISFAQNLPHLRRLILPGIDLRQALPAPHTFPLLGHGLKDLRFSILQPDVPLHELASILDRLFPNLDMRNDESVIPRDSNRRYTGRRQDLAPHIFALQGSRT
ncbi:hypothetical protein BD413DRAFT_673428 [Trametes elegans]|nr:hypothetical protein BD413DRAFT_673428 [Trametes elegans]